MVGETFRLDTYDPEQDGFLGTDGFIECQWTHLTPPTKAVMTWRWMHDGTMSAAPRHRIDQQATLAVTLHDASPNPDTPRVRIQLRHESIPVEWVDDVATVWRSKIDQGNYQSDSKQRDR